MKVTSKQAVSILIEKGCENVIKEDRFGDTKAGWFQDDVFLGKDPVFALAILEGN